MTQETRAISKHKKTIINVLLILLVLSFFVTPLGYWGKLLLNQITATAAKPLPLKKITSIDSYQWRLKDENWNFFSFEKSRGRVSVIVFWASWILPACEAEMKSLQALYDTFGNRIDYYIITNEEREPVIAFMKKHELNFPITYQIIGDPSPLPIPKPPSSYIIDASGNMVYKKEGITDWGSKKTFAFIEELLN